MSIETSSSADAIDVSRSKFTERLLIPASFITTSGNALQITAASVLVYHANANAVAVGWVFVAFSLPGAVLAFMFGKVVDRHDRRTLSVIADVSSAVIAFLLPVWLWSGGSHSAGSYATTLLLACSAALFMPASNALVKERVKDERLGRFNAHFELVTNAGMLIGSGLAGVLYTLFGPVPLFLFNSGTFVVSATLTYLVGRQPSATAVATDDAPTATPDTRPTAQPIKRIALLYVNASLGLIVVSTLFVVLILHNFHKGPWLIGVSDALAFTGFLTGAAIYPRVSVRIRLLPLAVLAMLASVVFLCLEPLHYIALICFIPFGGMFYAWTRIAARTLLMKASPVDRVGRIFGSTQAAGLALAVLATVVLSWQSDKTRVQYAFWTLGAIQAFISIGTYVSLAKPMLKWEKHQAEIVEPSAV